MLRSTGRAERDAEPGGSHCDDLWRLIAAAVLEPESAPCQPRRASWRRSGLQRGRSRCRPDCRDSADRPGRNALSAWERVDGERSSRWNRPQLDGITHSLAQPGRDSRLGETRGARGPRRVSANRGGRKPEHGDDHEEPQQRMDGQAENGGDDYDDGGYRDVCQHAVVVPVRTKYLPRKARHRYNLMTEATRPAPRGR